MGHIPPPLELTTEEFNKRWNAGARTMAELDPITGRMVYVAKDWCTIIMDDKLPEDLFTL